ncbi:MAG: hypothetical protein RIB45_10665 [Marivibrio sp.]|uniref:hypothetical protein n=1 Tax=Marivibrio sp. TaxID=2039719 RepID=UPI0032ECA0B2
MMKKGIYIETKPVTGDEESGRRHLYLVYRDGKGGEQVINGGPEHRLPPFGQIKTEADKPLADSKDKYKDGASPQSRRARQLDLDGMDPEIVWRQMTAAAEQVEAREFDYDAAPMQNSNSTIRHVIEAAGLDPAKAFPKDYSPAKHPGYANDLTDPNERTGITRDQIRDVVTMLMAAPAPTPPPDASTRPTPRPTTPPSASTTERAAGRSRKSRRRSRARPTTGRAAPPIPRAWADACAI